MSKELHAGLGVCERMLSSRVRNISTLHIFVRVCRVHLVAGKCIFLLFKMSKKYRKI